MPEYQSVEYFEQEAVNALKACDVADPYSEYDIKGFAALVADDQRTNAPMDDREWWAELKRRKR